MIELTQEQVRAMEKPQGPAHFMNPQTRETFVLISLADYQRLMTEEEYDDSPLTDEERDLVRWDACQILDSWGKQP